MDYKTIRFIDSDYKNLFPLLDGDNIWIKYRGFSQPPVIRECGFIDEMHVRVGNSVYHTCEFASNMERAGAWFEPSFQLQDTALAPYTVKEAKRYTCSKSDSCIGHAVGEFGRDGERFWYEWEDHANGMDSLQFRRELYALIFALRKDLLKDEQSMAAYCRSRPESKFVETEECERYGFKFKTKDRIYYIACTVMPRHSRYAIYPYAKRPAAERIKALN